MGVSYEIQFGERQLACLELENGCRSKQINMFMCFLYSSVNILAIDHIFGDCGQIRIATTYSYFVKRQ
jgi:hypothetical protein